MRKDRRRSSLSPGGLLNRVRRSSISALMKGLRPPTPTSDGARPASAPAASRRQSHPGQSATPPPLPRRPSVSRDHPSAATSVPSSGVGGGGGGTPLTRQRKRRASLRRPSTLDWEGFLWKRGGGTSTLFSSSAFARRYFVLDSDGDLFYYKDVAARHAGNNLKRPFKVRGCTVQRGDLSAPNTRRRLSVKIAGGLQSTSDHLVFSIRPADQKSRTLALCAETVKERDHWIRVLRTASLLPPPLTGGFESGALAEAEVRCEPKTPTAVATLFFVSHKPSHNKL